MPDQITAQDNSATAGAALEPAVYDICVIGGGINGVGIARDAAGRGLSVVLLEQDDLAQGTSSRSGKLVHGGLRYLEYYEFRLVRQALIEREVLLESAPHIIWPMRFVLPHSASDRPAWLVRLGLFLYDHLGGRRRLPGTRALNLSFATEGEAIKEHYKRAFEYSDCWVDDARLVVLNAVDAAERGARILTRTACTGARRQDGLWQVDLHDKASDKDSVINARTLVNATGPWVESMIDSIDGVTSTRHVRLVKGSHIVVRKFWEGDQAYLVQNTDKRVIFINPYENDRALIGTTDIPYDGDPASVQIEQAEIDYLLAAVNRYFVTQLSADDILQSFSGVRPLYDDDAVNPSAVTRDYLFDVDGGKEGRAALLSVFGGKITTFRKLAEQAIEQLADVFPLMKPGWTATAVLPGGDMHDADFDAYVPLLQKDFAFLPDALVLHYARLYGTRARRLLQTVESLQDLGLKFSETLYEVEVRYLAQYEWAKTAEDILQRRTKHGLHMSPAEYSSFVQWCDSFFNGSIEADNRHSATSS